MPKAIDMQAKKALSWATYSWFITMLVGQWIFVYYILVYYGGLTLDSGLAGFGESHLPGGYVPGDTIGNVAVVSHVLLAILIHGGGPLQLVPQVRARFPRFHRWNGRLFVGTAILVSLAGLYMTWIRGGGSTIGDTTQHVGTSISGVLVLVFAWFAVASARGRDFKSHRQWALRLFMVVSTVWFSRLLLWGWVMLTGGVGVDWETFTGPALSIIYFAQWVLPLLVLELYFSASGKATAGQKAVMAFCLAIAVVLMIIGIVGATQIIWLPRM